MRKIAILFFAWIACGEIYSQAPELPQKDLSVNKIYKGLQINAKDGFRQAFNFEAPASDITQGYTIEFRAKINSKTGRGLDIEGRDIHRNGFRISTTTDKMSNLTKPENPEIIGSSINSDDYHTFRFAVEEKNVHVYRDGEFLSTQPLSYLIKEDVMKAYNPGFESPDMNIWTLEPGKAAITTAENEARTGTSALKLSTSAQAALATLTVKELQPNTGYAFGFWAKGIVMNGNMRYQVILGHYDENGTFVESSLTDWNGIKPTKEAWVKLGRSFDTGEKDNVLMIRFLGWNGNNTIVLDDFTLTQNESIPNIGSPIGGNLLKNGTFDSNIENWPATGLDWPLASAAWSSTKEGQLQIKENPWGNNAEGNYNVTVDVTPGHTYKLSAKTSHLLATAAGTFRYIRLVDGIAKAEAAYTTPAGLSLYSTHTTPPLTVSNESSTITMQFTTKVLNSTAATTKVVMTLDDVELQEYESSYTPFITFGKLLGQGDADIDVEYFNYTFSGAYAPGVVDPNKALWNLIESATETIDSAEIGNIPGKYPQSAYDTYQSEIQKAKTKALAELTEEDRTAAILQLTAAGEAFQNALFQGEYYPQSISIISYASTLEQGEATSTRLDIKMNNNLEVDYDAIDIKYNNQTPEIIEINEFGSIIGQSKGTGKLEVEVSYDGKSVKDTVEIAVLAFETMTLDTDRTTIAPGDSIQTAIQLNLNDGTPFQTLYYAGYSNNRQVAEYSSDGKIYAIANGTAQVTIWAKHGNVEKQVVKEIKVSDAESGIQGVESGVPRIYPNPAKNEFQVTHVASVEIYNLSGQCVMNIPTTAIESTTRVNIGGLDNGVYLVKLNDVNNTHIFERLIINR